MNKEQKIAKLLELNRQHYHTFSTRASNARLIVTADEQGLDMMLAAMEA